MGAARPRGGFHRVCERRYVWAAASLMPTHGGWAEGAVGLAALPARPPVRASGPCGPTLPRPLPAGRSGKKASRARSRRAPSPVTARLIPRRPEEALPAPPGEQGQAAAALRRPAAR